MSEYHVVQKGETLSQIAKMHGATVNELAKLNQISNPNRLEIGQEIELLSTNVLGVQLLFLDLARDPISGLEYIMEYCGKRVSDKTKDNGLGKKIYTNAASDIIKILIKRFDGTLKDVGSVTSGYGNKLVTIICSSVKVEAKTEKHPDLKEGERPDPREPQKPIYNPKEKQPPTDSKKELGPKTTSVKTSDGKPLIKVEGDIQYLDEFLDKFVGGELSQQDIESAASELKCEPGLIYAIARQESAHSSFFTLGNRVVPKILYERHWFRKLTRPSKKTASPYEEKYYDICGPAYHKTKKNKKKEVIDATTGTSANPEDIYGGEGKPQYVRLIKAYQLDKEAALKACSWGKFQIVGFNYKLAGFSSVFEFTKAMSRGDAEHMKAFLKFAKSNNILLSGLREKNFEKIALGHNGESWKTVNPNYATNVKSFFNEYSKNHSK